MKKKNRVGRPPKFSSEEELQAKVDAYFDKTPRNEQTITGMALFLDTTRETLCDYQGKDGFSDIIKRAKLRVEHACELIGVEKGRPFDIFRLKQLGWKDKQEIESTVTADVTTRPAELPEHLKELISGIAGKS